MKLGIALYILMGVMTATWCDAIDSHYVPQEHRFGFITALTLAAFWPIALPTAMVITAHPEYSRWSQLNKCQL